MSNLIFPNLPGVAIEVQRKPYWESTVQKSVSGCSVGATAFSYPIWKYKLSFEFLRSGAQAELQQIVGFFNKHRGRVDTWLYFDEEDCTATGQQFGVGDGVTTQFYLGRDFGGFVEPVTDIKKIDQLTVGGVSVNASLDEAVAESLSLDFLSGSYSVWQNDYAYAGNGRIQFAAAPAAGVPLLWSGQYYRRCRFSTDELDTERFLWQLWKAKSVEFETSKGR